MHDLCIVIQKQMSNILKIGDTIMKKIMMMAMMMVMTISAKAMSYNEAKREALFLSDKMAYELNLTAAQFDDVYEINLDYLMSVNGYSDAYGKWWNRRNNDLKYVLTAYQYEKYLKLNYFYRPLNWEKGSWTFVVYNHYKNKNHFYKGNPKGYSSYKGGNNKKSDRFYADRNSSSAVASGAGGTKPTGKRGNDKKANGNGSVSRNSSSNNRALAQSNSSSRGGGIVRSGRR